MTMTNEYVFIAMTQTAGGDKEAEVRSGVEWSRVETAQGGGESGYTDGMLSAVIARYCLRLDTAGVTSTTTQHGTRAIVNIRARTHTRTLQPDIISRSPRESATSTGSHTAAGWKGLNPTITYLNPDHLTIHHSTLHSSLPDHMNSFLLETQN